MRRRHSPEVRAGLLGAPLPPAALRRFVEDDVLAFRARRLTGAPAHAGARAAAWASVAEQVLRNAEADLGRGSRFARPFQAAHAELMRQLERLELDGP
jgi:hypothetical protein